MGIPYKEIPSKEELFNKPLEEASQGPELEPFQPGFVTATATEYTIGVIGTDANGYVISENTSGITITIDNSGENIDGYNWAKKAAGGSWVSINTQEAPDNSIVFTFDPTEATEWQIRGRTLTDLAKYGQPNWEMLDEGIIEIRIIPEFPEYAPIISPFTAKITSVSDNVLTLNVSYNQVREKIARLNLLPEYEDGVYREANTTFENWMIAYKTNYKRDLYTYLHFGGDQMHLVTNIKSDIETFPQVPYSAIFKLYESLPEDIEEKDNTYIVREMLPQKTEIVELVAYDQEDEDVLVLRVPDSVPVDSPITKRLQN